MNNDIEKRKEIIEMIKALSNYFNNVRDALCAPYGLSSIQAVIVLDIYHHPDETKVTDICKRLHKSTNTISPLINRLVEKFNVYIGSEPSLTSLRYFMNDIEAKIFFAKGDYYNSLGNLTKMHKKNSNDYSVLLSKAFIEINLNNTKGFETYKKVAKRKDVKKFIIEGCIEFIDNALKNNIHDKGLLILCKGILTYYWINSLEGLEIIHNSLRKINNQNIKKYVKARFKNNVIKEGEVKND